MSQETHPEIATTETGTSSVRLVATLGLAGFLSGLVLVGTYLFTLPMIQANKARALQTAIYQVLPGCKDYKPMVVAGGTLVPEEAGSGQTQEGDVARIYAGYAADGSLTGFAIPAEEPGFQDIIAGIIGFEPVKQQIIGFVVLESKETPGLGDKILKDPAFQENFVALSVEPSIAVVKKGEKKNPNEMDAITGATISSKAIGRLLNKGMDEWKKAIETYMNTQGNGG